MSFIFDEERHEYTVNGIKQTNVTTLLAKHKLTTDYSQVDPYILQEAADFGKRAHKELELYFNGGTQKGDLSDLIKRGVDKLEEHEVEGFMSEVRAHHNGIAGTVDLIAIKEGFNVLVDFKFTYSLNKNAVMWQTSLYKLLLEKYIGLEVKELYVLWYNKPKDEYEFLPLPIVPQATIDRLFKYEAEGKVFKEETDLMIRNKEVSKDVNNILLEIDNAKNYIKDLESQIEIVQQGLLEQMEINGVSHIELNDFRINYIKENVSNRINYKKMIEEHKIDTTPYQFEVKRKAHLRTSRTKVLSSNEIKQIQRLKHGADK